MWTFTVGGVSRRWCRQELECKGDLSLKNGEMLIRCNKQRAGVLGGERQEAIVL